MIHADDDLNVTQEALEALREHFAGGSGGSSERGWSGPEPVSWRYRQVALARFLLPGFSGPRTLIGTDGSVTEGSDLAGVAAVHGDGYVTVSVIEGPAPHSQTAEMAAVMYALRRSGHGHVMLMLDNLQILEAVQLMNHRARVVTGGCQDQGMAAEVLNLLSQDRQVTIRHVPDAEGGTTSNRMPSQPLMAAAHRLAWTARRLAIDGYALEGEALAWLQSAATRTTRRTNILRLSYDAWRRRQTLSEMKHTRGGTPSFRR
ncbi:hypothetical protein [Acrocarpospora catenulata]|uniref:hypothetical protein n=1 Tax=Acrocarpospora catenulata TaxID=2836182 RepID=UPI001BD950CB|nr:hypothetical protein [Acrocarpospora catenulata]